VRIVIGRLSSVSSGTPWDARTVRDKAEWRRQVLAGRAALTAEQRVRTGEELARSLAPLLRTARRVASYAAVGTEPPTGAVNALCTELLLPVLLPDGELDWALAAELRPGPRGLLEPGGPRLGPDAVAGCDLVLVPALAVDASGTRLGRGGGSYDRALARTGARTIALLYDGELVDALPAEPHDVRVRAAVTPATGLVELPR
jgi:5-formyltetrahydrofolate cyclo-ligase